MIRSEYVEFLVVVGDVLTANTLYIAQRKRVLILDLSIWKLATEQIRASPKACTSGLLTKTE